MLEEGIFFFVVCVVSRDLVAHMLRDMQMLPGDAPGPRQ